MAAGDPDHALPDALDHPLPRRLGHAATLVVAHFLPLEDPKGQSPPAGECRDTERQKSH